MQEEKNKNESVSWLEERFITFLNQAMNKTIALDIESKQKLSSFEGKTIRVDLDSTPIKFKIEIIESEIHLKPVHDDSEKADTTIKGSPLALFSMTSSEPISGLPSVQISGDASTGQFFQKWFKNLDPDWEEAWCQLLGDRAGVRVSDTAKSILNFGIKLKNSLLNDSKDYLVEETKDLLAQPEIDDFLDQVDDLKSDVANLEYRITQIKKQKL